MEATVYHLWHVSIRNLGVVAGPVWSQGKGTCDYILPSHMRENWISFGIFWQFLSHISNRYNWRHHTVETQGARTDGLIFRFSSGAFPWSARWTYTRNALQTMAQSPLDCSHSQTGMLEPRQHCARSVKNRNSGSSLLREPSTPAGFQCFPQSNQPNQQNQNITAANSFC